jgi:hypothetical protein
MLKLKDSKGKSMHDQLPAWEVPADKTEEFAPLVALENQSVGIAKVGTKVNGVLEDIMSEHIGYGRLKLYNRGGGPAVYVGGINEWMATSWILKVINDGNAIVIETENSAYRIRKV